MEKITEGKYYRGEDKTIKKQIPLLGACTVKAEVAQGSCLYYEVGALGAMMVTTKSCLSNLAEESNWVVDTEPWKI